MRKLVISHAAKRHNSQMGCQEVSWLVLTRKLSDPTHSADTLAEFLSWDKERQQNSKDVGYYLLGECRDNMRGNGNLMRRSALAIDIDRPGINFKQRLSVSLPWAFFWHTTRKHQPDSPRIRVIVPLAADVTSADEHEALARHVASTFGIDAVDPVSYRGAQMAFWPSVSKGAVFDCGRNDGPWLDPRPVLEAAYIDPSDRGEWPYSATYEGSPATRKDKAESPLTKPGAIGAFCRAFDVRRAMDDFIPGTYEEIGDRYRYHKAEGAAGALVYDDDGDGAPEHIYSNHTGHDPIAGRSTNAFDLVRVHKFGHLDTGHAPSDSPTQLPSYKAMHDFAMSLPDVVRELDAAKVFAGLDDDDGELPGDPPRSGASVELIPASSLTPENVTWLWLHRLAEGKLNIVAGQPATGKTTLVLNWMATITRGGAWPDGSHCATPGNVVIWSGEDAIKDTLLPRLLTAGADHRRVFFVGDVKTNGGKRSFDPALDMPRLEEQCRKLGNVRAVLVDPILNAVSGDSHKAAEVRRGLQPLADLAGRQSIAVIGITHVRKSSAGHKAAERIIGSGAFVAFARCVHMAVEVPDGGGAFKRAIALVKGNNSPDDIGGFSYRIVQQPVPGHEHIQIGAVQWGEQLSRAGTAELFDAEADDKTKSKKHGNDKGRTKSAAVWLVGWLTKGPQKSNETTEAATDFGIKVATLYRAKDKIGVIVSDTSDIRIKMWTLPQDVPSEFLLDGITDGPEDIEL